MIKRLFLSVAALLLALAPMPVLAEELLPLNPPLSPSVTIIALQTGGQNASDEFVELYNGSSESVSVAGWRLQYRSASGMGEAAWATKVTIACDPDTPCLLAPGERLLLATYALTGAHPTLFSGGFSAAGGQVRILYDDEGAGETVADMVGYGIAAYAEGGQPATAPLPGQSLLRNTDADGLFVDTNVNASDFSTGCYQPPDLVPCAEAPSAPSDDEDPDVPPIGIADPVVPGPPPATEPAAEVYLPLHITELLPDPAGPQVDSADEFIELFNPHSAPVNVAGYRLESGDDFRYHYTFSEGVVAPGEYVAVRSADSHLTLTNSGTAVRVLSPNGDVLDQVADYGQAKAGQAWAKDQSGWQWTTEPTPGASNVIATAPPKVLAAAAAATKAVTTKKAAAPKTTKAAKTPAPPKTIAKAEGQPGSGGPAAVQSAESGITYVLFIVIGLAIMAYLIYEYRKEIVGLWHKIKATLTPKKAPAKDSTLQMD